MTTGALYSDIYADGNARQHNGNAYSTNTYKNTTESSNSHNGNTYNTNTQYGNNYSTTTHHGHVYNAPATTYNMPQSPNPFAQIMESAGQPTQLHRACAKGDEGLVRSLLDSGENIEAQNANFMTPLQVAVQKNQLNVVKLLLDRGANIEAKYRYWGASDVSILLAVHNHNEEMVRLLVDHGADTEETGRKLLTPLGVAAMEGQDRIVAVLVSKGAKMNVIGLLNHTPPVGYREEARKSRHHLAEPCHLRECQSSDVDIAIGTREAVGTTSRRTKYFFSATSGRT